MVDVGAGSGIRCKVSSAVGQNSMLRSSTQFLRRTVGLVQRRQNLGARAFLEDGVSPAGQRQSLYAVPELRDLSGPHQGSTLVYCSIPARLQLRYMQSYSSVQQERCTIVSFIWQRSHFLECPRSALEGQISTYRCYAGTTLAAYRPPALRNFASVDPYASLSVSPELSPTLSTSGV